MHTKISDEYVIKKRGLRGLLSYVSSWCILILHQRFMVVYLRFIFDCCVSHIGRLKQVTNRSLKYVDCNLRSVHF